MPRQAVRRKALQLNNNDDHTPKKKIQRIIFNLPLPVLPRVDGKLLVCGQGDMGQLGLGDDASYFERKRPTLVNDIDHVVDVKAGGMHNVVLTSEGLIYTFGCNDEGALGRDSTEEGSEFLPKVVQLPAKVLKISAGDSHSACLLEDGRVFAWGSFRDSRGNMGLTLEGNKRLPVNVLRDTRCCDISSGSDHLVILTCKGKIYSVGCGEQGQLGRISGRSVSGDGRRGKTELLSTREITVKTVKHFNGIWTTNYSTFMRDAQSGHIWACGLNNYKQLTIASDTQLILSHPVDTKLVDIKQISGGQHHTILLKNDGSCFAVGRHDYGRLGLDKLSSDVRQITPIESLSGKTITFIACGEAQSFALTAEGKLYAWGMGSNHQLGTGSEDDEFKPVLIETKQTLNKRIISASSGGQHSIFVVHDDSNPEEESKVHQTVSKPKVVTVTAIEADSAGEPSAVRPADFTEREADCATDPDVSKSVARPINVENDSAAEADSATDPEAEI